MAARKTTFLEDIYFPTRFYLATGGAAILFILAFFVPSLFWLAKLAWFILIGLMVVDIIFLFFIGPSPLVRRQVGERMSNGDPNTVRIVLRNRMRFPIRVTILDELPVQFQARDFSIHRTVKGLASVTVSYDVRPVERGQYQFGRILVYAETILGLVTRRCITETDKIIQVYPSYMHFRQYRLLAESVQLAESGTNRHRKIGHSMEFEQIKEYVPGDDIRSINWKATARKGTLMANHYMEERSQQVYCVIDKGRLMKMPFEGLSLLDYAINSALIMSNVCLQRQDKIGLISFADRQGEILPADRKPIQQENMLQLLYKQQTGFLESDFEWLYKQVRYQIKQRSLLILYTNFESMQGLNRQLPYLRLIARHHLLLVVFFENSELTKLSNATAITLEDVYTKTIAEKFVFEKRLIARELQKYGILSILTTPEQLTIHTVNKYLELKNRQAI
ncbi:MAG TPA: DUF58 domain-containing protein [Ferruginibacter sp.]|nr:DUF58 domain-containing protein [Ferruginibacter sp.]